MAATAELSLTLDPTVNSLKTSLELLAQLDQTLVTRFLDCPLSELYCMPGERFQAPGRPWLGIGF